MLKVIQNLFVNRGFVRYFKNTSWLLFEKIFRMVIILLIGVWVARYLGPEKFGMLSYARSYVALFTVIATLGLDGVIIRELVKEQNKRDKLLGTSFVLKLFGALLVIIIISISFLILEVEKDVKILCYLLSIIPLFQSLNVIDFYFQSNVQSKYVVYSNIASILISVLIKVFLILFKAPLVYFAAVTLIESVVISIGLLLFYKTNRMSIFKWQFEKKISISLLKDCWPLILSSIVVTIYMKIDQIMIKEMLTTFDVGQYAAAVRISGAWYFIPAVIAPSLFPAIINAKKNSEEVYYKRLQHLFNLLVWIAISISIPMTFFADRIITLLYGDSFYLSSGVLKIHIWAGVFAFLGVASGKWLLSENLTILSFWRTFIGMFANIYLNVLLIPRFGINGAAVATLISYMIAGFLFDIIHRKTRIMFFMKIRTLFVWRYLW